MKRAGHCKSKLALEQAGYFNLWCIQCKFGRKYKGTALGNGKPFPFPPFLSLWWLQNYLFPSRWQHFSDFIYMAIVFSDETSLLRNLALLDGPGAIWKWEWKSSVLPAFLEMVSALPHSCLIFGHESHSKFFRPGPKKIALYVFHSFPVSFIPISFIPNFTTKVPEI